MWPRLPGGSGTFRLFQLLLELVTGTRLREFLKGVSLNGRVAKRTGATERQAGKVEEGRVVRDRGGERLGVIMTRRIVSAVGLETSG